MAEEPSRPGGIVVRVEPAEVRLGRLAARVPVGTPTDVQRELRRLLLAEHAMQAVEEWARTRASDPSPPDRFARGRLVDAAGLAVMFGRPFTRDDQGNRLEPDEWRSRIEDRRPELVPLFDRLLARRHAVFAHADTTARVTNVANTQSMFGAHGPGGPIDLRVYDVGAADELLASEELSAAAELAATLAELFSARMVELGAERVRALM